MPTSIVKVYNTRYNEWAENVRVELGWNGITSLGFSQTVYTDRNGTAVIDHAATGECTVYVNGRKYPRTFNAPGTFQVEV